MKSPDSTKKKKMKKVMYRTEKGYRAKWKLERADKVALLVVAVAVAYIIYHIIGR